MGLFFQARSWRAPLQLIDCWLPSPDSADRTPAAARLANLAGGTVRPASPAVQRFARAGWLGRKAANAPELGDPDGPPGPTSPSGTPRPAASAATSPAHGGRAGVASATAGQVRARVRGPIRPAPRLVLSGRMDQVCAELDRLVAQEEALQRAA